MNFPLLIMNVQVFSSDMHARYLTSKEAILHYNQEMEIKIPLNTANTTYHQGLVIGEQYFVRYVDGIEQLTCPPEFRYIGMKNKQLVFSSISSQAA